MFKYFIGIMKDAIELTFQTAKGHSAIFIQETEKVYFSWNNIKTD